MRISDWSSDVCSSDLDFGPLDPPDDSDPWGPAGPPEPPDFYEGPGDPWVEHSAQPDETPEAHLVLRVDASTFVSTSSRGRVVVKPASAASVITAAAAIAVAEDGRFWAEWDGVWQPRSEEHTSELQSLLHISYAVFCLKKKKV